MWEACWWIPSWIGRKPQHRTLDIVPEHSWLWPKTQTKHGTNLTAHQLKNGEREHDLYMQCNIQEQKGVAFWILGIVPLALERSALDDKICRILLRMKGQVLMQLETQELD